MEAYEQIIQTIALSMGVAWASGLNLYATILVLGWMGSTGAIALPLGLDVLTSPVIIVAAALMYAVEFFADKVPGVDTGWDAIHTFIRIPAGAVLAASAVGEVDPAMAIAAGILGGGVAAGTHLTKAGSRIIINASPEPFTNGVASVGEDVAVVAGLWTALNYPLAFVGLLIAFVAFAVWLLPKILRGIRRLLTKIANLFRKGE